MQGAVVVMVTKVFVGEVNGRHGDHKSAIPSEAQLEQAQIDMITVFPL